MRTKSRALLSVLALSLAAAACRGPRGSSGAPGSPGPTGPTGPAQLPPEVEAVYPRAGSANTIFTVSGENYSPDASLDRVFFDGYEATIVAADSASLTVQPPFLPVGFATTMAVAVQVSNATSNTVNITAYPNGAHVPYFEARMPVWQSVANISRSPTATFVADPLNGAFRFDTATGAVSAIARNDEAGIATVQSIHVAPNGRIWLHDSHAAAAQKIDRLLVATNGSWSPLATFALSNTDAIVSVDFDSASIPYVTKKSGEARRLLADGSIDPTWNAFLPVSPALSSAFLGGSLYTLVASGDIYVIDSTGNPTLFAAADSLNSPNRALLVTDGTALYCIYDFAMETFDGMGTSSFYGFVYGSAVAYAGGGAFEVRTPSNAIGSYSNAGATFDFLVGGFEAVGATGHVFDSTFLGSASCTTANTEGSLYILDPSGSARRVASVCANVLASDATGALYALTQDAHLYRVSTLDGMLTPVASSADGITNQALISDGTNLYVDAMATGGEPSVAKITNGVTDVNFIVMPLGATVVGLAADATSVWIRAADGRVYRAPITGGTPVPVTSSFILGAGRGLVSDGAGGVIVADPIAENVYDVPASGPVTVVASGVNCFLLDRERSRNLRCVSGTSEISAVFP